MYNPFWMLLKVCIFPVDNFTKDIYVFVTYLSFIHLFRFIFLSVLAYLCVAGEAVTTCMWITFQLSTSTFTFSLNNQSILYSDRLHLQMAQWAWTNNGEKER